MSDEDDSDGGNNVYVGTRLSGESVRTNATRSMRTQQMLSGRGGDSGPVTNLNNNPLVGGDDGEYSLGLFQSSPQPTVWNAVNYPEDEELQFESYYIRYERQPEAKAIIDKPVNDTWKDGPVIKDSEYADSDSEQSDFDEKVEELMNGDHTRRKPLHRLKVLDKLARLGHYAVMFIGFSDGRDTDTPVGGVSDSVSMDADGLIEYEGRDGVNVPDNIGDPEFDSPEDMFYLAVYGEDRIIDLEEVDSMTSPRFRLPQSFDVVTEELEENDQVGFTGDYDANTLHWTRCIHVPEGTLEDDISGIPALKPCFHELLNIDKIRAASGEGYWRAGYQGLHVRPPQDSQGKFMEFENDGEDVHEEIQKFMENFDRTLATPAQIDSIESSISDPNPHLDANYEAIASTTGIPKSILSGRDRADTADASDLTKYERTITSRRNNYATPRIVRPFIQRLIDTGVLPEPEGEGFVVEWPSLEEMTEMQEWEKRLNIAQTIKTAAPGGDTSMIATVPELRQAIGWSVNVGGNVSEEKLETDTQEEQMPNREAVGQGGVGGELGGDPETSQTEAEADSGGTGTQSGGTETEGGSPDDESGGGGTGDGEGDGENVPPESESNPSVDQLPSSTMEEFEFPDETFERPVDAESRAEDLGMDPVYHIEILDGDVYYVPGRSVEELRQAKNQTENMTAHSPPRTEL